MDELGDIEARRAAYAANLRRAFGAPVRGEPPAFAALLRRLAAKQDAPPEPRAGLRPDGRPGAPALARALGAGPKAAWSHSLADT